MNRILLTNPIHPEALSLLEQHAQVIVAPAPTPEAILAASDGCDGIIVRAQLPDGIFATRPRLRVAVRHGTGVDFIPLAEATRCGVVVANVPGVNAASVAEHATLLMLGLARRSFRVTEMLRKEGWNPARECAAEAVEVQGCTVGLVGYGSVGRRVAAIWRSGFDAQVLAHSHGPVEPGADAQVCGLDELLDRSHFVVLACPLTDETRAMVNAAFLARMKRTAYLVNVARGPIVEERALLDALRAGTIAGAGLDVYDVHPLPAESELLRLPQVIATPHCAGISGTSLRTMGVEAVRELLRVLAGEQPNHFVNPDVETQRRAMPAPAGLA